MSTPDSCFYAGSACSCLADTGNNNIGFTGNSLNNGGPNNGGPNNGGPNNGGSSTKWACYGSGDSCPATKPDAGTSCKQNSGAACPYPDHDFCTCAGNFQDTRWECQSDPVTCPNQRPSQGQSCSNVRACQYADDACFCNGDSWHCLGG